MNKNTFYGTDASNKISLLEYGLLVSKEPNEDGSGTHFIIYRQSDRFGTGHISEKEIDSLLSGNGWMEGKDMENFYSSVGENKDTYLSHSLANKLADLIGFWGYENIMGTDYSPISEAEAINLYL